MKTLLSYILLTLILVTTLSVSANFASAEDDGKLIYIPITENFIGIGEDRKITVDETELPIKNCQELFSGIQKNLPPGSSQRTFIDSYEGKNGKGLWKEYPQCFVTGTTGVGIISNYLATIYQWLAGLVGGVAVLMIIIGGVQIATGGGDQNNVTEGKTKIMQALAGLVILFLSGLILYTINPTFYQ